MAHRYRVYPTAEQAGVMLDRHWADARFVWNLAVEQFNWGRSCRPAPGPAERMRQLAEARQEFAWLGDGSSSVQQQAPVMRRPERRRVVRLQQRLARCQTGSRRRDAAKAAIARIHQQVADRRRDWVEKTTTQLAARYEVIGVEALPVRNMARRPRPKPDPDNEGGFLPNGAAAKVGLHRSIYANCWGLIARRPTHTMCASGTTV